MRGQLAQHSKPRRWLRRMIWVLGLLIVVTIGILIRATFITAAPLYTKEGIPEEVEAHLNWIEHLIDRSEAASRLDIYSDYSEFCGEGIEWNYGFYVFYALSLDALAQRDPSRREYVAHQLDRCTRLMLDIPRAATNEMIAQQLDSPEPYAASLVTGYQCLILSIRRQWTQDTLYDEAIRGIATALRDELRSQLKHCASVWTSDQSTQLHAIWRSDQALGTDHSLLYEDWLAAMQDQFIEAESGFLYSQVSIQPDRIDSPPRATSIAWSIIFLADLYPDFAGQQYDALRNYRVRRVASLSAFAEFPGHNLTELGDMDSGPIVLGISPAATGFGLAAHRIYGTPNDFERCYRFFELFGFPKEDTHGKHYWLGNGMGDAILLYSKIAVPRMETD